MKCLPPCGLSLRVRLWGPSLGSIHGGPSPWDRSELPYSLVELLFPSRGNIAHREPGSSRILLKTYTCKSRSFTSATRCWWSRHWVPTRFRRRRCGPCLGDRNVCPLVRTGGRRRLGYCSGRYGFVTWTWPDTPSECLQLHNHVHLRPCQALAQAPTDISGTLQSVEQFSRGDGPSSQPQSWLT